MSLYHFYSEICLPGPWSQHRGMLASLLCCLNSNHLFRGFLTMASELGSQPVAEKLEVRSWCVTKHRLKPCPCLPLARRGSYQRTWGAASDTDSVLCTVGQWIPQLWGPSLSQAVMNSLLKALLVLPRGFVSTACSACRAPWDGIRWWYRQSSWGGILWRSLVMCCWRRAIAGTLK